MENLTILGLDIYGIPGNFVFNNYHNYIILYGEISYNSICTKINCLKKFRSLY